jgi:signal peptidase I
VARIAEHYRASGKAANRKWRRYALIAVLVVLAALVLQIVFRQLLFFPLRVSGDSMAPEIQSGDKRYFIYAKLSAPTIGDIVLVESATADVQYLCRVVGLDGDKVKIEQARLLINGTEKKILKPRLSHLSDRAFSMTEVEVRPNHFFCLNDNDQNTNDSRVHGIFERRRIIARVFRPALFF